MSTLTEMHKKLARTRSLLGKKEWTFDWTEGSRTAIERGHPLYNRLFTYTENAILISPRMTIVHKSTKTKFTITFDEGWGTMRLMHELVNSLETFNPDVLTKFIKNQILGRVAAGAK